MTDPAPGEQTELLPGMRAVGQGVPGQGRRRRGARARPPRPSRPRSTRWLGCWSTSRWPTSTAPSTTPSPRRWRRRPSRAAGSRSGSPARTSTGSSSPAPTRPTTPAGCSRCAGWSARSRCSARPSPTLSARLAERYAGTRSDVLRLAVPPRHATTEKAAVAARAAARRSTSTAGRQAWAGHEPAGAFLEHLGRGGVAPGGVVGGARRPTGRRCSPTPRPRRTRRGAGPCVCVPGPPRRRPGRRAP